MVWRKVVEIVESIESGLGWWCRRRGGARFLRRGKIWECEGGDEELRVKRKDRTASREDGGDGGRRV